MLSCLQNLQPYEGKGYLTLGVGDMGFVQRGEQCHFITLFGLRYNVNEVAATLCFY